MGTGTVANPKEYIAGLEDNRKVAMMRLRQVIQDSLPKGFQEVMSYGMIAYVVPHDIYPAGYHCKPSEPLPFISIASQKNYIALYHMGLYAKPQLQNWWVDEYPKHSDQKLDMGKSCIRFKKTDQIPYDLIAELCSKMTVKEWVSIYEADIKK
jgi:hypothetical protein